MPWLEATAMHGALRHIHGLGEAAILSKYKERHSLSVHLLKELNKNLKSILQIRQALAQGVLDPVQIQYSPTRLMLKGLPPYPHGGHLGQECEGSDGGNRPLRSTNVALEWV